jgi:4-phosphopantoate--beta-alanine ligase
MDKISKNHPRYFSLKTRETISKGVKEGLVHETGLIAHGRGEAFDYLIGEKTISFADDACKIAAAMLLCAEDPVISVNGNVIALTGKECISLADCIPAKVEVNLFHRTDKRINKLVNELKKVGAKEVFGTKGDARIPSLEHDRGICDKKGIFSADAVLVPLEDGDRCQALKTMGKKVIVIDLNPLSRSAKSASVTIVDNVIRAIPNIERWVKLLKAEKKDVLEKLVSSWDNVGMLEDVLFYISKRLSKLKFG